MQTMADVPQKLGPPILKRQHRLSESREQLNEVAVAVKEFLFEITDLHTRKSRFEAEAVSLKLSINDEQIQPCELVEQKPHSKSRRSEDVTLFVNFFLRGEGKNQLFRFWEAVKNGSNVGLTAPLVEILLDIAHEMLTVPLDDFQQQIEGEVKSRYFNDWEKLPHDFYDECLLETVQTIVPPRSTGAELRKSESKVNKSFRDRKKHVYHPLGSTAASLEQIEQTLVNGGAIKNGHVRNMETNLNSKAEANNNASKISNFFMNKLKRRSSVPKFDSHVRSDLDTKKKNKTNKLSSSKIRKKKSSGNLNNSSVRNAADSDSLSDGPVSKTGKEASTSKNHQFSRFYDNSSNEPMRFPKMSSQASVSRFESRVQHYSSGFIKKIKLFLDKRSLTDVADVVSFIFTVVQNILSLEFVTFSSTTNWRSVIKWCCKKIRKLQSEFSTTSDIPMDRHRNLPLINFISSFMVLSFSNYFQAKRSKRTVASAATSIADINQNSISDTDYTFGEIFTFLAKLHQSIRYDSSFPDSTLSTNWFNCIWRSLMLFGILLIKDPIILRYMTSKNCAPGFISNIGAIKQMILNQHVDLNPGSDVITKMTSLISVLGSEVIDYDHSMACPFNAVFDLFITTLSSFFQSKTHAVMIEAAAQIKLCNCMNVATAAKSLEEYIRMIDDDKTCVDSLFVILTKVMSFADVGNDSFKVYRSLLGTKNELIRTCLESHVLKLIQKRYFDPERLVCLFKSCHAKGLLYTNEQLEKIELCFESGELPSIVQNKLSLLYFDILQFVTASVDLLLEYPFKSNDLVDSSISVANLKASSMTMFSEKVLISPLKAIIKLIMATLQPKTVFLLLFAGPKFESPFFDPAKAASVLIKNLLSRKVATPDMTDYAYQVLVKVLIFVENMDMSSLFYSRPWGDFSTSNEAIKVDVNPESMHRATSNLSNSTDFEILSTPVSSFAQFNCGPYSRENYTFNISSDIVTPGSFLNSLIVSELKLPFENIAEHLSAHKNCWNVIHDYLLLSKKEHILEGSGSDQTTPDSLGVEKMMDICLNNVKVLLVSLHKIDKLQKKVIMMRSYEVICVYMHVLTCKKIKKNRNFRMHILHLVSPALEFALNECSESVAKDLLNITLKFAFFRRSNVLSLDRSDTLKESSKSKGAAFTGKQLNLEGDNKSIDYEADESEGSTVGASFEVQGLSFPDPYFQICMDKLESHGQSFCSESLWLHLKAMFSLQSAKLLNFYCQKLTSCLYSNSSDIQQIQESLFESEGKTISSVVNVLFENSELLAQALPAVLDLIKILCLDYLTSIDLFHYFRLFLQPLLPRSVLLEFIQEISHVDKCAPKSFVCLNSKQSLQTAPKDLFDFTAHNKNQDQDFSKGFSISFWIKFDPETDQSGDQSFSFKDSCLAFQLFSFNMTQSHGKFILCRRTKISKRKDSTVEVNVSCFIMYKIYELNKNSSINEKVVLGTVEDIATFSTDFDIVPGSWIHVFFSMDRHKNIVFVINGIHRALFDAVYSDVTLLESSDLVITFEPDPVKEGDIVSLLRFKKEQDESGTQVGPRHSNVQSKNAANKSEVATNFELRRELKYRTSVGEVVLFDRPFPKNYPQYLYLCGPDLARSDSEIPKMRPELMLNVDMVCQYEQTLRSVKSQQMQNQELRKMMQHLAVVVEPAKGFIIYYVNTNESKESAKFESEPVCHQFASYVTVKKTLDFDSAVQPLGGPNCLIYFFAKIVEQTDSTEGDQCQSLDLVLKYMSGSVCQNIISFDSKCLESLVPVFESNKVSFSNHMIDCFIRNSCEVKVVESSLTMLIRNVGILTFFLRNVTLWKESNTETMMYYLQQLQLCVESGVPVVRDYNRMLLINNEVINSCVNLLWNWSSQMCFKGARSSLIGFLDKIFPTHEADKDILMLIEIEQLIFQLHPNSKLFVPHSDSSFFYVDRTVRGLVKLMNVDQLQGCPEKPSAESVEVKSSGAEIQITADDASERATEPSESSSCYSTEERKLSKSDLTSELQNKVFNGTSNPKLKYTQCAQSGRTSSIGVRLNVKTDSVDSKFQEPAVSEESGGVKESYHRESTDTIGNTPDAMDAGVNSSEGSEAELCALELMLELITRIYTPHCLTFDSNQICNVMLKLASKFWIVLMNSRDVRISCAVLNLVHAVYNKAGNTPESQEFLRCRGFHLMANQLYLSRHFSFPLTQVSFRLFFNNTSILEDDISELVSQPFPKLLENQKCFHRESFPLLISLYLNACSAYEDSKWHCDMANSILSVLHCLYDQCENLRQLFLTNGTIPALLNATVDVFLAHKNQCILQSLLKGLGCFFATVAGNALLSPDVKNNENIVENVLESLGYLWYRVAANTSDYFKNHVNVMLFQMYSSILKMAFERLLQLKYTFDSPSSSMEWCLQKLPNLPAFLHRTPSTEEAVLKKLDSAGTDISDNSTKSLRADISTKTFATLPRYKSSITLNKKSSADSFFTKGSFVDVTSFCDESKELTTSFAYGADYSAKVLKPKLIAQRLCLMLRTMKKFAIVALPRKLRSADVCSNWCIAYHDYVKYFVLTLRELLIETLPPNTGRWSKLLKDTKSVIVASIQEITHCMTHPDLNEYLQTVPLTFFAEGYFESVVKAVYGGSWFTKKTSNVMFNDVTKCRLDRICRDQNNSVSVEERKLFRRLELSIPAAATTFNRLRSPEDESFTLFNENEERMRKEMMCERLSQPLTAFVESETKVFETEDTILKDRKETWLLELASPHLYWIQIYNSLRESVIQAAISVETIVYQEFNAGVKSFMFLSEKLPKDSLTRLKLLACIVNSVTHIEGVWYEKKKSPQFWQLDQTEGPLRIKKRLERCRLNIDPKHIRVKNDALRTSLNLRSNSTVSATSDEHRSHAGSTSTNEITIPASTSTRENSNVIADSSSDSAFNEPLNCLESVSYLDYIFSSAWNSTVSFSSASVSHPSFDGNDSNMGIQAFFACNRILPYCETVGDVLLTEVHIYFLPSPNAEDKAEIASTCIGYECSESFMWAYSNVREVHHRLYSLKDCAVEIFLTTGLSCMLAFDSQKTRDDFCHQLLLQHLPNLVKEEVLEETRRAWANECLTNFAYLTAVNKFAGRTTNDLMQYPVFPFLFSEYESEQLHLHKNSTYRDLSKPVSVQNPEKETIYAQKYREMTSSDFNGPTDFGPYHYSSLYSNSGIVLHYLVRLMPFARMFLHYQGGSFDIPDRTFSDLVNTWKLASQMSMTDVKELIPEFFYLPEFLLNKTNFELGTRQDKQVVHHVKLPAWAMNDPRLFVLVHRQALESSFVSKHLNKWIDLIFGFKQTGKPAIDSFNVYRPCLYYGFDLDAIDNDQTREAVERMIRTYGQTPKMIFKNPHPARGAGGGAQVDSKLVDFVFGGALGVVSPSDERLDKISSAISSPIPGVYGLKWGNYVGSPAFRSTIECWRCRYQPAIANMFSLPRNVTAGVQANSLVLYRHQKDLGIHEEADNPDGISVQWLGVLTYGYKDGFMRFWLQGSKERRIMLHEPFNDEVVCMCVSADSRSLYAGCKSGLIWCADVKSFELRDERGGESKTQARFEPLCRMPCHLKQVNVLVSCRAYSIFVSGSDDRKAAFWDSNRNSFIRSLTVSGAVKNVAISETLGDVAIVSDSSDGSSSCVTVFTINGDLIGKWTSPAAKVTAITYSNAPEGISVNCIAVGLSTGLIVLLDSWMINQIREITENPEKTLCSIISLAYRSDAQILYASFSDGWLKSLGSKELSGDLKKFRALDVIPSTPPISGGTRHLYQHVDII